MKKAIRAGDAPIAKEVKANEVYWWCSCGRSQSQPFCDGSHKGSKFHPVKYTADKDETLYFCACKQTANAPLCDGSHQSS